MIRCNCLFGFFLLRRRRLLILAFCLKRKVLVKPFLMQLAERGIFVDSKFLYPPVYINLYILVSIVTLLFANSRRSLENAVIVESLLKYASLRNSRPDFFQPE